MDSLNQGLEVDPKLFHKYFVYQHMLESLGTAVISALRTVHPVLQSCRMLQPAPTTPSSALEQVKLCTPFTVAVPWVHDFTA